MSVMASTTPLHKAFPDWEEAYQNRAYMMARLEMQTVTEVMPNAPEAWFLLGLSELASRDAARARKSFATAQSLVGKRAPLTLPHGCFDRIAQAVPLILKGIDNKTLTSAPTDWKIWLAEPDLILNTAAALASKAHQPLGRVKPLMPLESRLAPAAGPGRAMTGGVLASQLPVEKLKVDSMRDLLGRDANLRVDRDDIRIQESIIIRRDLAPGEAKKGSPVAKLKPSQSASSASIPKPAAPATATPYTYAPTRPAKPAAPVAKAAPIAAAAPAAPVVAAAAAPAAAAPVATQPKPAADAWAQWEEQIHELVVRGHEKEAMARINEALARYPESSRLSELKADLHEQAGNRHEAAKAYIETYKKAVRAGGLDRANRAYKNALELSRENGDLLMDLFGLAAAAGSVAMATSAGKLAVDLYRRRNDRPRLMHALQSVLSIDPSNMSLKGEVARLQGELQQAGKQKVQENLQQNPRAQQELAKLGQMLGDVAGGKAAQPFEIIGTSTDDSAYGRTHPPARDVSAEELRRRAASNYDRSKRMPETPNAHEQGKFGGFLMMASIFILFLSVAMGPVLPFLGYVVSHIYVKGQAKSAHPNSLLLGRVARGLFVVGVILGMITKIFR